MRSGSADDHRSQCRNEWFRRAEPQPVAEIMPKRQAELLAGLHQPEHAVTRQPAVATDGAPGNLSLDDKAAQISFRRIGMQRRFRSLQNAQQFCLAAPQSGKEFVEVAIPGSNGENSIEPDLKALGCPSTRTSRKIFQSLVEEPDEFAQGLDMLHLVGRCRHQLVQQPFGMAALPTRP